MSYRQNADDRAVTRSRCFVGVPPCGQPAEERHWFGTIGTISVTSAIPALGQVTQNDPPVRTSQGQLYIGIYTVNFSFTPRGEARQIYQSTVGVTINQVGAILAPPILIRSV